MAIRDLLEYLKYNNCDCKVRIDKDKVRGTCSNHPNSVLLVGKARVGVVLREVQRRKSFDKPNSKIV